MYVHDVLSWRLSPRHSFVEVFEKAFACYVGRRYAVAVSSGTAGLHLITKHAIGKKAGNVVTTPLTFVASANIALYEGRRVVFSDVGGDFLLDELALESTIRNGEEVAAVIYVDIFGNVPKSRRVREVCERYGIFLIEDASQAVGAKNGDLIAGQLGHAAVFSFNKNKQITSGGEGGMIVTDDEEIYRFCLSMRDQGRADGSNWLDKAEVGYNYRMTEIQAAIGLAQLEMLPDYLAKRRRIVEAYCCELKDLEHIVTAGDGNNGEGRSWFIFYILISDPSLRQRVIDNLKKNNIECKTNYFPPVYKFKAYRDSEFCSHVAEKFYKEVVVLPLYFEMTDDDVRFVTDSIKECYE